MSGLIADVGGCWRAADWLGEEPVEPHQTGATLLAEAEADDVRIWGGEAELDSALAELKEDEMAATTAVRAAAGWENGTR